MIILTSSCASHVRADFLARASRFMVFMCALVSLRARLYSYYFRCTTTVFTLKDILGLSIFVPGDSKERKNGALKVMDDAIFS